MTKIDTLQQEIETLRDRLSKLSEASLCINESLDFDTVLAGVPASACSLTGARYGVITLRDGSGEVQNHLAHGMPTQKTQKRWDISDQQLLAHPSWPIARREKIPLPPITVAILTPAAYPARP